MSRRPPASDDTDQGFLKRWSRRKADPEGTAGPPANDQADPAADEHRVDAPHEQPGPDDHTQEPIKTDADMPDLDSINDGSDVSEFFSPGVSQELRNQALRRLFRTARFNVIDPLDDYNEDFRNFELLGDLVTSDMRHRMEMDEQQRAEARRQAGTEEAGEPAGDAEVEHGEPARTEPGSERTAARQEDEEPAAEDAEGEDQDDNEGTDSGSPPRTTT